MLLRHSPASRSLIKVAPTTIFPFTSVNFLNWIHRKRTDKQYVLTSRGKEFANRLDTETATEKQAKMVLIIGCRKIGQETQFLVQQRLKQPYFGFWIYHRKNKWGELVRKRPARELRRSGFRGK